MATTATTANATLLPRTDRRILHASLAAAGATAASQWGVLMLLSRIAPPETLGELALGLAVASPVFLFANLQLRSLLVIDFARRIPGELYLSLRLLTSALAFGVVAALAWPAGASLERCLIIVAVGGWKAVEALGDLYCGLMQQRDRMDQVAVSVALKGALSMLGLVGAVAAGGTLLGGVLAAGILVALVVRFYDLPRAGVEPRWRPARPLLGLVLEALPLGVMTALVALNANVPRYVVEKQLGLAELGVLAAVGALPLAGNMLVNALGQAAQTTLGRHVAHGDRWAFLDEVRRLLAWGLVPGVLAVILALVAGRELLGALYRPEYGFYTELLCWQMGAAACVWLSTLAGYAATALHEFRAQIWLLGSVVAVSAIASLRLVSSAGLSGAGMALALAAGWQLLGSFWVLAGGVRRRFN